MSSDECVASRALNTRKVQLQTASTPSDPTWRLLQLPHQDLTLRAAGRALFDS